MYLKPCQLVTLLPKKQRSQPFGHFHPLLLDILQTSFSFPRKREIHLAFVLLAQLACQQALILYRTDNLRSMRRSQSRTRDNGSCRHGFRSHTTQHHRLVERHPVSFLQPVLQFGKPSASRASHIYIVSFP